MPSVMDIFFEVSSYMRKKLRDEIEGPISIIEMRGLEFLLSNQGARQKDLAAYWGITNASVSAFVSKAEKMGLVARKPDPNDKRATRLSVTEAGKAAVSAVRESAREVSSPVFDRLTQDEQVELARLLTKLHAK